MINNPIKLFMLPFSGGNSYSYNVFKEFLPKHIEVIGLELPGRGKRNQELLLNDVDQMADDLFNQIQSGASGKYMIFGHSLGAILALLLCRKLQNRNIIPPSVLFISGHKSASLCQTDEHSHLSNDKLIEMIKKMEGTPKELLQSQEFIDYFLPILRADFNAINNYSYNSSTKLKAPMVVLVGRDEQIAENELKDWKAETTGPFSIHEFDGGHFFIFNQTKEVCSLIIEKSSQIILP